jgi:hypothetical protein
MLRKNSTYNRPEYYQGNVWQLLPTLMVSALPTPSADYRGVFATLLGASGVADRLYWCMKDKADAYGWVQIA